ncbi:anhydro-N-acetylmuramic acid kinase [Alteromonadaceae bacterium M269]|nr:anhydro-N-acetylmuramic acid kinase [Alteromonadaceae bacterium M269]
MHSHIQKLFNTAQKKERLIIGLMSGTSLDGLDIALCRITDSEVHTKIRLEAFQTIEYGQEYRENVQKIFSKRQGDIQHLTLINAWIGRQHGQMINQFIKNQTIRHDDIDCIASHGQTIYHSPIDHHQLSNMPNATLQIGDGDHIAHETGIMTISDFRQKHIAAGGQGAPLVMYGDYLIFSNPNENRIMLNIGGIANLTYLPKSRDIDQTFSTDIGPGNTMMDALAQQASSANSYDKDAKIAKAGSVNLELLNALHDHSFFTQKFPKTTGPELFNLGYLEESKQKANCSDLGIENCMATLNYFSAECIYNALVKCHPQLDDIVVYASGGGIHNPLLLENLKSLHPSLRIKSTNELGVNPDAKEAMLFALLANECLSGSSETFANNQPNLPNTSMGKISFPD